MPREAKRPAGWRLWLRRRRGLLRPGLRVLAVFALVGVVWAGVAAFDPAGRLSGLLGGLPVAARDAGLAVREVTVEGARNTPPALLRAAVGARVGDPILAFSPGAARERLEALAWVESAHVERRLPGTVLVRVVERRPFAIWQNGGRFAVVDREGRVVATDRLDAFGPLPLVVGPGANTGAAALLDVLDEHAEVLARVQALVRVGERRWNLHLHNGADVLLPEGHEAAAVARLAEEHRAKQILDRPLVAVDLRMPDRMVLRAQPTAPAAPTTTTPASGPARGGTTGGSGRG